MGLGVGLSLFLMGALCGPLSAQEAAAALSDPESKAVAVPVAGATGAIVRPKAPPTSPPLVRPVARPFELPAARWDGQAGTERWTMAAISALQSHAQKLARTVPRDIAQWCPAYRTADVAQRRAFWVGLVSALAWHESTHRAAAVGGDGRWYGLTQIYPPTARGYGCRARNGSALMDAEDNLSCALRIMAVTVPRDGVVSQGMRGVAADWGPFHSQRKRTDMQRWVKEQDYCSAVSRSLKPVARPAPDQPEAEDLPSAPTSEAEAPDSDAPAALLD